MKVTCIQSVVPRNNSLTFRQDVGIADKQKAGKQGRDDNIKQFSTQLHPTYLFTVKDV